MFRLDLTISKKQENPRKSHFFGLRKNICRKNTSILNQNHGRYMVSTVRRKSGETMGFSKSQGKSGETIGFFGKSREMIS